jgi:DNA-binding CsgD family transcriptional regulator
MTFVDNNINLAWPFSGQLIVTGQSGGQKSSFQPVGLSDNIFEEWFSIDIADRLVVDRQGKITWCRISNEKYDPQHPYYNQFEQLRAGNVLPADFLLPILNAGALVQGAQNRIAVIESNDTRKNIVVRVAKLGGIKQGLLGVTFLSFTGFNEDQKEDLKRIWDLSDAEIRILSMTVRGMTLQEVASVVQISPETARTHMRHIYVKVGASSREGLFAALGATIG